MTKNKTMTFDTALVAACAINEQYSWDMLSNATGCDNCPDVWERFMSDACAWTEWAQDVQRDIARNEWRRAIVAGPTMVAPWAQQQLAIQEIATRLSQL